MALYPEKYTLMEQNGFFGRQYVTDDDTLLTGSWFAIQAVEGTTIEGLTEGNITDISGCVIPAGSTVFGSFTVVNCSGKAILYNT